jgi:hypothetical protein
MSWLELPYQNGRIKNKKNGRRLARMSVTHRIQLFIAGEP